jgi:predicted DCC family thiol-disulfide oxidoreductase YuxK
MQDAAPAQPEDPAVLLFDGACGFCTAATQWLARRFARPVRTAPWQAEALGRYGLSPRVAAQAAWWIEPDGTAYRGHRAIARALLACRPPWRLLGRVMDTPGSRALAWLGYELVAHMRGSLPGAEPAWPKGRTPLSDRTRASL